MNHSPRLATLKHRSKKAVGAMHVWPEVQIRPFKLQRRACRKQLCRVNQLKIRMFGQKALGLSLIFFNQQAAGGVYQTPTRGDTARRTGQNTGLQGCQLLQALHRLAPLQVRIAAQGANAATRGVDQDTLRLTGQASHPRVVFVLEHHRHNV